MVGGMGFFKGFHDITPLLAPSANDLTHPLQWSAPWLKIRASFLASIAGFNLEEDIKS